jgi:hypothetical protein
VDPSLYWPLKETKDEEYHDSDNETINLAQTDIVNLDEESRKNSKVRH